MATDYRPTNDVDVEQARLRAWCALLFDLGGNPVRSQQSKVLQTACTARHSEDTGLRQSAAIADATTATGINSAQAYTASVEQHLVHTVWWWWVVASLHGHEPTTHAPSGHAPRPCTIMSLHCGASTSSRGRHWLGWSTTTLALMTLPSFGVKCASSAAAAVDVPTVHWVSPAIVFTEFSTNITIFGQGEATNSLTA